MNTNNLSLFTSLLLIASCSAWACDDEAPTDGAGGSAGAATDGDDDGSSTGGGTDVGGAGGDMAQTGGTGGGVDAEPTCYPPPDSIGYWWDQESSDLSYQIGERLHDHHLELVAPAGYGFSSPFIGSAATFSARITAFANSPVVDGDPWPQASLEFWFSSYNESSNMISWSGAWGVTLDEGRVRVFYEKKDTDGEGPETGRILELITADDSFRDETFDADLEFHHVAVVNDVEAAQALLYVDGKLAGTLDFAEELELDADAARAALEDILDTSSRGSVEVGGESYGNWMSGYVDEISLYSEMLSAAEIKGIFDAGALGKCTD